MPLIEEQACLFYRGCHGENKEKSIKCQQVSTIVNGQLIFD